MPSLIKLTAAVLFLAVLPCHAQTETSSTPKKFEAASVRQVPAHSVDEMRQGIGVFSMGSFPSDRFTAKSCSLTILISMAYGISSNKIVTGESSLDSPLYDVTATVGGGQQLTLDQMRPLLRQLLAERFHLAAHHDTKELSGYDLVVAKGGPKLQKSDGSRPPGGQILPEGILAWNATTTTLAGFLERPTGRPVEDKTGIQGNYDFRLDYAAPEDTRSYLPSVFTAVQDKLGLKLEPAKVKVETLVIDRIDRVPTEN